MKKRDTDLESGDPGGIEVSKTPRFFIFNDNYNC